MLTLSGRVSFKRSEAVIPHTAALFHFAPPVMRLLKIACISEPLFRRRVRSPLVIRMHPLVRRYLARPGQFDHADRWRVAAFAAGPAF